MEKNSRIYIAGHKGLVGSALERVLRTAGYKNILSQDHENLDLRDQRETERFFQAAEPEYIFMAAAKVGGIRANMSFPADFIYDNLQIQNNVTLNAWKFGAKKMIFIGSSCAYPTSCPQPIKEEYLLTGKPELTNEPYAIAKLAGIALCQSFNRQHGTHFISIVPANLFGPGDNFHPENSHFIPALIHKFHIAKTEDLEKVTLWGTGNPIRELLYSEDLAEASLFLMKNYDSSEILNVGSGEGQSIREVAKIVGDVVGFKGRIEFDSTKPDGMMKRVLNVEKINALGWNARTSLQEGIVKTYSWFKQNTSQQ